MATSVYSGPLDYAVFVVPRTHRLGEGLRILLDRVDQGLIELLDLEVIGLDGDRAVRLPLSELGDETFDAGAFEGAESDILDDDDLAAIAAELGPDTLAVAILYEDRSLAAVADAWTADGGALLWSGGIAVDDLANLAEEGES